MSADQMNVGGESGGCADAGSLQLMVSGGPIKSQHKLKATTSSRLRGLYRSLEGNGDEEREALRRVLQIVLSSLLEDWKGRGDKVASSSTVPEMTTQQRSKLPQMEVVIASPERATFRLSEDEVAAVLKF